MATANILLKAKVKSALYIVTACEYTHTHNYIILEKHFHQTIPAKTVPDVTLCVLHTDIFYSFSGLRGKKC